MNAQKTSKSELSLSTFTWWTVGLLVFLVAVSLLALPGSFIRNTVATDQLGAKEGLLLMKDWAIWMASIQSATIAALGILSKDGALTLRLSPLQERLTVLVAIFNTSALFFSAWILTSLSTTMLRVYEKGRTSFDFYNFTIYSYMEKYAGLEGLTIGFFAFWNHWLWASGIATFGALAISLMVRKTKSQPPPQPEGLQ